MKCFNCGSNVNESLWECPYCGMTVSESRENIRKVDQKTDDIKETLKNIYLGKYVDCERMSNDEIVQLLKELNVELEKQKEELLQVMENDKKELEEKYLKLLSETLSLSEYVQKNVPIRANIDVDKQYTLKSLKAVLNFLVSQNPKLVEQAAFTLRRSFEGKLKERFGSEFSKSAKACRVNYDKLLKQMNLDKEVRKKVMTSRVLLNAFVHDSDDSDTKLKDNFKSEQDKINFIFETYRLYKGNGLLREV